MHVERRSAPRSAQRARMVWEQLSQRGIRDQRVLEAMGRVPRELFVPAERADQAYEDKAIPLSHNQTISQPYMVALTLEALALDEDHHVLEIGTGSGYVTALLAQLVREVISMECVPELAATAGERLAALGIDNARVVTGDGSRGYAPCAPFHRIAVAAAAPQVPPSLVDQLDEGGILVLPVGDRSHQILRRVRRRRGEILTDDLCPCVYVPLLGEEGWSDTDPDDWMEGEGEEERPPG